MMKTIRNGDKGHLVKKLQSLLLDLGYHPGPIDGHFGSLTEDALEKFQSRRKIYSDGICGSSTLAELLSASRDAGIAWPFDNIEQKNKEPQDDVKPIFSWIKCRADKVDGYSGYSSITLREDAAESYNRVREEVLSLGGVITSAGGRRPLSSKSSPSRSKKSMHYVGLALDLALPTGMQKPEKDPYIVVKDGSRYWEVWCRTENTNVPEVELTAVKVSRRKGKTVLSEQTVKCRAFNLTDVFKRHGWDRIKARRSFFRGGSYGGAEWWHFQYEDALQEGESTFGEELLKVYEMSSAKKFVYWNLSKDCVFGENWF